MTVTAVATGLGAAATVYGASQAGKGGGAQVDASNAANQVSQDQYNQTRADNAGTMLRGEMAGNKLQDLLGLSSEAQRAYIRDLNDHGFVMPEGWVPYADKLQAFIDANPQYDQGGSLLKNFDANDLAADPIYQSTFQTALENGNAGINRLGAAQGNLNSGATLKALTKFGANTAATYGADAYSRYTANQNNQYNKLAGVSGAGQQAVGAVGSAGAANASTIGNNLIGAGNARAASAVGSGNALTGGLSSIANYYQQNKLLDALKNNNAAPQIFGASGGTGSFSGY